MHRNKNKLSACECGNKTPRICFSDAVWLIECGVCGKESEPQKTSLDAIDDWAKQNKKDKRHE